MKCDVFQQQLTAFAQDQLTGQIREECEAHLLSCESCFSLWLEQGQGDQRVDLADSILAATGSDTCTACEELLGDFVDGILEQTESRYVQNHIDNCADCQAAAAALVLLDSELASLSATEPRVNLTASILARTTASDTSWSFYTKLMHRPRISLEASFVFTMIFVLIFGIPTGFNSPTAADALPQAVQLKASQRHIKESISTLPALVKNQMGTIEHKSSDMILRGSEKLRSKSASTSAKANQWINQKFETLWHKEQSDE